MKQCLILKHSKKTRHLVSICYFSSNLVPEFQGLLVSEEILTKQLSLQFFKILDGLVTMRKNHRQAEIIKL